MLEVSADRCEALQVLDRLLAASLAARSQRRPDELLEQGRLAVRGGHEDTQVATRDAEPRQLRGRADDLEIGLVVDGPSVATVGLDDAELLNPPQDPPRPPALVEDLTRREPRARRLHGRCPPRCCRLAPPARAGEVAGCQLLADHSQR